MTEREQAHLVAALTLDGWDAHAGRGPFGLSVRADRGGRSVFVYRTEIRICEQPPGHLGGWNVVARIGLADVGADWTEHAVARLREAA